ncbi:MAG: HNH endonuclease [Planctomycetaceae bacterium]|jgi:hypothetical protein|nr:HNH endonuclease [Planctomycetaceae bacterium]
MIKLEHPSCPNPQTPDKKSYKDEKNKGALRDAAFGKCMYCESKIEHNSYAHIEHIKPKAKYPELEFVWENLGYSCERCNTNKSDKYEETTPFINPYTESPEVHIVFFGSILFARQGSERGQLTINEIKLNRPGLIEKRAERLKNLDTMIKATFRTQNNNLRKQALDTLKQEAEKDKEYSAMVKSMLKLHEIE